jgi:hypothetical protein
VAQTFYAEKGKPKGLTFDTAVKKETHVEFALMNKPFNFVQVDGTTTYGKPGDYLVVSKDGILGHYLPSQFLDKYHFTNTIQTREEFLADPENQAAARDLAKAISDEVKDNWFNETELAIKAKMPVEEATKKIGYCYLFGLLRSQQHEKRGIIYKIELQPADQLAMLDKELGELKALTGELERRRATFVAVHGL